MDSVGRAVSLLGLETIQAVALAGAVFRPSEHALPAALDVDELRRQGCAPATWRRDGRAEGWPIESLNHTFLAGMLHEVGLLVLAARTTESGAGECSAEAGPLTASVRGRREAELDRVRLHGRPGQGLPARAVGLPEQVVQAIATRRSGLGDVPPTALARALDVAAHVAAGESLDALLEDADSYLDEQRLAEWQVLCDEAMELWSQQQD